MRQSGRSGNSWFGWLVFIFLVFGSRFLPPLAAWLSQVTGLPVTVPMLIGAVVVLAVVASVGSSLVQQVGKARSSGDTRLPTPGPAAPPAPRPATPPPVQPRAGGQPRAPSLPPSATMSAPRLPSGEQRLPSPPRFEPIIDPRIFAFGVVGLVVLGGLFFLALLLAGSLP
jgi:hypothetical protein